MTESHQAFLARLDARDEFRNAVHRADALHHADHRLVGAAVQWTVQGRDCRGGGGIWIGMRRADRSHSVGRAILLMVSMQDEEDGERMLDLRNGPALECAHL